MAGAPHPKGPAQWAFAGVVAVAMMVAFGIATNGLFAGDASPDHASARLAPGSELSSLPKASASVVPASAPAPNAKVHRILNIDGPLRHGEYVWDDADVPPGPVVVTIDLKAETLSVFRGGYEVGVAAILYGATDKPSPLGAFPILEKDADHISNLYGAPMPYMLRLTNDGVAIHGSDVEWGRATHGCIGVPTPFARKLFGVAHPGDLVIITNGKMMELG